MAPLSAFRPRAFRPAPQQPVFSRVTGICDTRRTRHGLRSSSMRAAAIAVLTLAAACASGRPCASIYPKGTPRGSLVWDVRGPGGSIVVFGTHHAAGDDDIPEAALAAIDAAQLLVVEAPEGPPSDTF